MKNRSFRINPRSRAAFTLVELLCVVALLLVLMALLLPAVEGARDRAVTTSCQHQERQIWMAIQMYCGDNNGAFVCWDPTQAPGIPVPLFWFQRANQAPFIDYSMDIKNKYLTPYVSTNVWHDPGAPDQSATCYGLGQILGRTGGPGTFQYYKCITGYQGSGPVKLGEIPRPATTAMLACKIAYYYPQNLYATTANGSRCALTLTMEASEGFPWALHGPWFKPGIKTKTNVTRVDGSARTYETKDLVTNFSTPYFPGTSAPYWPNAPYWGSAARAYLWSGWAPLDTAAPQQSGWLGE